MTNKMLDKTDAERIAHASSFRVGQWAMYLNRDAQPYVVRIIGYSRGPWETEPGTRQLPTAVREMCKPLGPKPTNGTPWPGLGGSLHAMDEPGHVWLYADELRHFNVVIGGIYMPYGSGSLVYLDKIDGNEVIHYHQHGTSERLHLYHADFFARHWLVSANPASEAARSFVFPAVPADCLEKDRAGVATLPKKYRRLLRTPSMSDEFNAWLAKCPCDWYCEGVIAHVLDIDETGKAEGLEVQGNYLFIEDHTHE